MKFIYKLFLILLSINVFAVPNNLELIVVKNENTIGNIDYSLKIKNIGVEKINFLKPDDASFMNFGVPSIEFVAETYVNGKWVKFKDPKVPQIDYYSLKFEDYVISIEPNEEVEIGRLYRTRKINSWFNLLDDALLNVYFIYKIKPVDIKEHNLENEFKKHNLSPITLTSNKIEVQYKNNLSKREYNELKQEYMNSAFREYIKESYSSSKLLKNMKKISNTNGKTADILAEVLGTNPYKYVSHFLCRTKDEYNCTGILYISKSKLYLGIYAGTHYFSKDKKPKLPLEYLFGLIPIESNLTNAFLYKN